MALTKNSKVSKKLRTAKTRAVAKKSAAKTPAKAAKATAAKKPQKSAKPAKAVKKSSPAASSKQKKATKAPAKPAKSAARKTPAKATTPAKAKSATGARGKAPAKITKPVKPPKATLASNSFLAKQQARLLNLKDVLLDSMNGVAKHTLRHRAEGSEGSAFGMHQADAGSDAYDRDFALSLLSQEQNSLYEIDEALKRIDDGTYGTCEISGKPIPHARLEALPFTRYTVECQAELEKQNRFRARVPVTSLFGITDDSGDDDDASSADSKE